MRFGVWGAGPGLRLNALEFEVEHRFCMAIMAIKRWSCLKFGHKQYMEFSRNLALRDM